MEQTTATTFELKSDPWNVIHIMNLLERVSKSFKELLTTPVDEVTLGREYNELYLRLEDFKIDLQMRSKYCLDLSKQLESNEGRSRSRFFKGIATGLL